MSIAKELEVTTKVKRGKLGEQEFLKKILSAVADLPEKSWNSLSLEAQAWYNASVDGTDEEKEKAPANEASKKSKKEKPANEKPLKKKGNARESMARINIVKCLCKTPDISNEEIAEQLEKDGVKVTKGNIQATAHYTRLVIKVMKDLK